MLSLLERMSKSDVGAMQAPALRDAESRRQRHHLDLLVDAGHAMRTDEQRSSVRITNAGYDFLEATRNQAHGQKAKAKFLDLFNQGVPYARASQAAVELVPKVVGA